MRDLGKRTSFVFEIHNVLTTWPDNCTISWDPQARDWWQKASKPMVNRCICSKCLVPEAYTMLLLWKCGQTCPEGCCNHQANKKCYLIFHFLQTMMNLFKNIKESLQWTWKMVWGLPEGVCGAGWREAKEEKLGESQ